MSPFLNSWILTPRGPGLFGFVHRTFLEYLSALELAERFKARELDLEALRDDFILPRVEDDAWKEVIRLLMGLLPPAQADGLILEICPSKEEAQKSGERLALAWQCIAEIDPKQLAKTTPSCTALIEAIYEWLAAHYGNTPPGASGIVEGLRALEPGCWPFPVLQRWGFPSHGVHWWPTYGDCNYTSHYKIVFPVLCDCILAHEPDALEAIHRRVQPDASPDPFTREELIRVIAERFGDRPQTREVLLKLAIASSVGGIPPHSECDYYREATRRQATSALASLEDRDAAFESLRGLAIEARFPEVRSKAISSLAASFSERSRTKAVLVERIHSDVAAGVRRTAVAGLASLPSVGDELFQELHRLIDDDQPADVREAALEAVAASFVTREETVELLRFKAVEDESANVRRVALEALARDLPGEATARLLRERSIEDPNENVRGAALKQLSSLDRGREDTFEHLRERLGAEESEHVRLTVVQILDGNFADRDEVQKLIEELTRGDESERVRKEALLCWGQRVLSSENRYLLLPSGNYGVGRDPRKPISLAAEVKRHNKSEEETRSAFERMVDEHGLPLILEWRSDI